MLLPLLILGAECSGTCVPPDDLQKLVEAANELRCYKPDSEAYEAPQLEADPITIVVDEDGRVFFNGAEPHPYRLTLQWCGTETTFEGKLDVVAAVQEDPRWGFRFRPKAYLGYLPLVALDSKQGLDGVDAGLMLDFFHVQWFNVNAAVGVRSVGAGVGLDITRNFGAYVGYGLSYQAPHHGLNGALWFAF
jgi:hypothetical protein